MGCHADVSPAPVTLPAACLVTAHRLYMSRSPPPLSFFSSYLPNRKDGRSSMASLRRSAHHCTATHLSSVWGLPRCLALSGSSMKYLSWQSPLRRRLPCIFSPLSLTSLIDIIASTAQMCVIGWLGCRDLSGLDGRARVDRGRREKRAQWMDAEPTNGIVGLAGNQQRLGAMVSAATAPPKGRGWADVGAAWDERGASMSCLGCRDHPSQRHARPHSADKLRSSVPSHCQTWRHLLPPTLSPPPLPPCHCAPICAAVARGCRCANVHVNVPASCSARLGRRRTATFSCRSGGDEPRCHASMPVDLRTFPPSGSDTPCRRCSCRRAVRGE